MARWGRGLPGVLATLLVLLGVWGCARGGPDDPVLVVYSAGPRSLADAVTEAFAEEYGVRVELFAATTGQVMARLEAERYRPRADVVVFASRVAAEALREGDRLLAYPSPEWLQQTRTEWHDPDGYFHSTSAALVGMAFGGSDGGELGDPDAQGEPVVPGDPDWPEVFGGGGTHRLTLPAPSRSGAAGDFVVAYTLREGESAWDGYLAARRAGLEISAANSQAISGLLVGAYDGIVGAVDYLIFGQIAGGAALRMHYPPSGSALVERPIAILADTPVPDLARDFVDFYFSEASQARVAAVHLLPARTDIPSSEERIAALPDDPERLSDGLPPLIQVDPAEALREQTRILRRFQLEIERAEVPRSPR